MKGREAKPATRSITLGIAPTGLGTEREPLLYVRAENLSMGERERLREDLGLVIEIHNRRLQQRHRKA